MAAKSFVVVALAAAGAAAGGLSGFGAPPAVTVSPVNCVTDGSASEGNLVGARDDAAPRGSSSLSNVLDRSEADGPGASPGASDTLASRARAGSEEDPTSTGADRRTANAATSAGDGPLSSGAAARSDGSDTATATAGDAAVGDAAVGDAAAADEPAAEDLAQALADALAGSTTPAARRIAAALADEGFVAEERVAASEQDAAGAANRSAAGRSDDTGLGGSQAADDASSCTGPGVQREDAAGQTAATGERTEVVGSAGAADDEPLSARGQKPELTPSRRDGTGADSRGIEGIASVLERTATAGGRGDGLQG
jgi:hypothetical protein